MSPRTLLAHRRLSVAAILSTVALAAAACGGGTSAASHSQPAGAQTVSVRTVAGTGDVLVDAHGAALYSPVQEAHGMVRCTGPCASIWVPLTVSGGSSLRSSAALQSKLGTVHRPGGETQVTYRGAPLSRFALDRKPGVVTGNGVQDAFSGQHFTWKVASVSGSTTSAAPPTRGY
jgi:predicted lipoprotein with Yx(FWY)xxD motif